MAYFKSWRFHRDLGWLLGLGLRLSPRHVAEKRIVALDLWAYNREWAQNMANKSPKKELSAHQREEAEAWGQGARKSSGLNPPLPDWKPPEERS